MIKTIVIQKFSLFKLFVAVGYNSEVENVHTVGTL